LQPVVVPHFDNHPLATRPVYIDDNARPHRSRAVTAYLQSEAVTSVSWPAMNPEFNPIEHIWDMLGRRIQAREPPVQNIRQFEAALRREWILSIDLHSSKSTIRLSFHFQNVTYESLDDIYCSKFSTGCNPHVFG
jgi:transposase